MSYLYGDRRVKNIVIGCVLLFSSACWATELADPVKQEIEHLLGYLQRSGCEFNRNGTWFKAPEATAHIQKKYDYLIAKNMLTTTESFIAKAAAQSSMSNKSYQVRCQDRGIVQSSEWFAQELDNYRGRAEPQAAD